MNFRRYLDQGEQVNRIERSAKFPSRRTGLFASRSVFADAKGSSAPSAAPRILIASALALTALLALGAASASAAPPTVTIDPVTDVSYTSAKVSGTVDPEGQETDLFTAATFGYSLGELL